MGDVTDQQPSWAPDGSRIVFETRDENWRSALVVVAADGTGRRQITDNSIHATDPDWAPDGQSIAFASDMDGERTQIYVMDPDGSNGDYSAPGHG
ncbi:MAG: hypothetical protein ABGY41_13900 [Candidatus Poribacteria bacterium]